MTHRYAVVIKKKFYEFDGNKLHFVEPFQGRRYSLVYFVCDKYVACNPPLRIKLRSHVDSTSPRRDFEGKIRCRTRKLVKLLLVISVSDFPVTRYPSTPTHLHEPPSSKPDTLFFEF